MAIIKETNVSRWICDTADVASLPTGVPAGSTAIDRQTGKKYITYDGTNWTLLDNRSRLVDSGGTEVTETTGHSVNVNALAGTAIIGKVGIDQTTPGTTDRVTANVDKVGGTAQTGRDIAADLAKLQPPTSITNLPARTTNAATAVQVVVASTPCRVVHVVAKPANTGVVYLGDIDVSAVLYIEYLNAGDSVDIPIDDANKLYFDVSVSGEGIQAGYLS